MLTGTFLHLPGIGPGKEKRLWEAGVDDWHAAAQHVHVTRHMLGEQRLSQVDGHLHVYKTGRLGRSGICLPGSQVWRTLRFDARGDTGGARWLSLDIETTGLDSRWCQVTVVGLCGHATAFKPVCLVCDDPQWKNKLSAYLAKSDVLLTYNGRTFDQPFLSGACRPDALPWPHFHVDLRYPLAALGYKGGLKYVQKILGQRREHDLEDVDGYMAVRLWREHKRGTVGALPTLVRYCLEDTVVLLELGAQTYEMMKSRLGRPWPAVQAPAVSLASLPYDRKLVRRLS